MQVLAWVTSFGAAEEFERAPGAGTPSAEVLTGYDAVGLLLLPVQLAAAIVTCLWLWQSRVLAEAVSPAHGHARSRVWVWLGWIVPVVALWFPYQVVRDVRAATVVAPRRGLGWRWAGWLLWSVATNVTTQLTTLSSAGAAGTFALLPVAETVGTAGVVRARPVGAHRPRDHRGPACRHGSRRPVTARPLAVAGGRACCSRPRCRRRAARAPDRRRRASRRSAPPGRRPRRARGPRAQRDQAVHEPPEAERDVGGTRVLRDEACDGVAQHAERGLLDRLVPVPAGRRARTSRRRSAGRPARSRGTRDRGPPGRQRGRRCGGPSRGVRRSAGSPPRRRRRRARRGCRRARTPPTRSSRPRSRPTGPSPRPPRAWRRRATPRRGGGRAGRRRAVGACHAPSLGALTSVRERCSITVFANRCASSRAAPWRSVLELTDAARLTAGIVLLTVVGIESGGAFLVRVVTRRVPATGFQTSFFRAGHAHAGVLVILGLVCLLLTEATGLAGPALARGDRRARRGDPAPGRLLPVGRRPRSRDAEPGRRAAARGGRRPRGGRRDARRRTVPRLTDPGSPTWVALATVPA